MRIAFLGTGIMGSGMARNLLKRQFAVVVWNRTLSKAESLEREGALLAATPAEAVSDAEVVITMLADPAAVEQVMLHEGVLQTMKPNSLWMDCSTVDPYFSRRMGKIAAEYGIRFLDAPVAGSKIPAEKGELLFLVGGNKEDVDEAIPLFQAMGKGYIHLGDTGMGASMKMVFNMLLAIQVAAFSEGVNLAEHLGMPKTKVMDILLNSPIVAPYLQGKKDKMLQGSYEPEFPLKWMQKDLGLITHSGQNSSSPLPIASVVKELFQMAKGKYGELDFSAIFQYYRDVSGN